METDHRSKWNAVDPPIDWRERLILALETAGAVPSGRRDVVFDALAPGDNLLPLLVAIWDGEAEADRGHKYPSWLRRSHADGAALTLGVPGPLQSSTLRWLGPRLAWWPAGMPAGRRVGIGSSRLGRRFDAKQAWFMMLRAACNRLDSENDVVLSSVNTASVRFVNRAAELFGLRMLRIEAASGRQLDIVAWLESLPRRQADGIGKTCSLVRLSASLETEVATDDPLSDVPDRDRALVSMSEQLLAFHVRKGGYMMRSLRQRLAESRDSTSGWPPTSVFLALGDSLIDKTSAAELMDAGAVGWYVTEGTLRQGTLRQGEGGTRRGGDADGAGSGSRKPEEEEEQEQGAAESKAARLFDNELSKLNQLSRKSRAPRASDLEPHAVLTHCTRGVFGPWPGQTEDEFLDEIILSEDDDRSPLGALERIARDRRLLASGVASRGSVPAVSFSAVPVIELAALRTFRPHRGRWDFEPYGICIRRAWLEREGTRPVCYGSREMSDQLPDDVKPYFQLHRSISTRAGITTDWTVEKEWRKLGDVDLSALGPDDAYLFVPTAAEAERIAALSPWPVAVLGWTDEAVE